MWKLLKKENVECKWIWFRVLYPWISNYTEWSRFGKMLSVQACIKLPILEWLKLNGNASEATSSWLEDRCSTWMLKQLHEQFGEQSLADSYCTYTCTCKCKCTSELRAVEKIDPSIHIHVSVLNWCGTYSSLHGIKGRKQKQIQNRK